MRNINELMITNDRNSSFNSNSISHLETAIGYKLPSAYINFVSQYNGGFPEISSYSNEQGEWDINYFFSIEDQPGLYDSSSVLWNYRHKWNGAKNSYLPIAQDGGGNLFCLDLDFEEAPVLFWTHDPSDFEALIIAPSFVEFINNLVVNPEFI